MPTVPTDSPMTKPGTRLATVYRSWVWNCSRWSLLKADATTGTRRMDSSRLRAVIRISSTTWADRGAASSRRPTDIARGRIFLQIMMDSLLSDVLIVVVAEPGPLRLRSWLAGLVRAHAGVVEGGCVERRHRGRCPEIRVVEKLAGQIGWPQVVQLEKAPRTAPAITLVDEALVIDADGAAWPTVYKSILLRHVGARGHGALCDAENGGAKRHQHAPEVGHQAFEVVHNRRALVQYHPSYAPLGILGETVAEGVVVLAPDGIRVQGVELADGRFDGNLIGHFNILPLVVRQHPGEDGSRRPPPECPVARPRERRLRLWCEVRRALLPSAQTCGLRKWRRPTSAVPAHRRY